MSYAAKIEVLRLKEENAELRARIARLEEALRPFVVFANNIEARYRARGGDPDRFPDGHPFASVQPHELRTGVWRRARAALDGGDNG